MTIWTQLLVLVLAIFWGWQAYRYIRYNPSAFSRETLGRSIFTLGILALFLIAWVALLVSILDT